MSAAWMVRAGSTLLVTLAAVVSGCGGGGGGSDEPPVQGNDRGYFPAAVGDRWVYRVTATGQESVWQLVASGHGTSHGTNALLVQGYEVTGGGWLGTRCIAITPEGVDELAHPDDGVTPAAPLLRFPIQTGESYPSTDATFDLGVDFDDDGRSESVRVVTHARVIGFESVITEEGTLPNAAHVRRTLEYTGLYSGGSPNIRWSDTVDTWYVDGIGMAREEIVIREDDGDVVDTIRTVLTGHSVGGRKSEAVAPTATLVSPQPGAPQAPDTRIELQFSETMDVASVIGSLMLRSPSGAEVPLNFIPQPGMLPWQITPAATLQESGTYMLSVTDATDLLGNRLAASSWPIVVDATAPFVVTSNAAAGRSVPLDAVFTIDFREDIHPDWLLYGGAWMSGPNFHRAKTMRTVPFRHAGPPAAFPAPKHAVPVGSSGNLNR